ncbi:MAG: metallophosphoesterase family protein [Mediterranea sp.]|jgi:hypothetical protein|nr:metallophosphoesterase family protein [Mediterranea sp.]
MLNAQSLRFHPDGTFKIVQFTDTHYKVGVAASDTMIDCVNKVLDAEKPDLVIFTGDVIYNAPAEEGLRTVLAQVSRRKIPFAVVFGNHDDEQGLSRPQLYDIVRTVPGNLLPSRGEASSPDYTLTIHASTNAKKDAATLYCMDSNAYSQVKGVGGYDWFHGNQVAWFRRQAAAVKAANQGDTIPALAFFHIPLPEYREATASPNAILRGTRMEKACSPELNSGMFVAMKEAGDVMATFVGHDHDNDYAVMWYDILLAYGRYTGGNTVYNHLPNGARVIRLNEGTRTFTTWLHLRNGQIVDKYAYPDDFQKKNSPNQ